MSLFSKRSPNCFPRDLDSLQSLTSSIDNLLQYLYTGSNVPNKYESNVGIFVGVLIFVFFIGVFFAVGVFFVGTR